MGSNSGSNSGGGNSYNNAQKARKASVPGTKIGFQGTYKSDINPNDDTAAKTSLFENQGATNIENLKTPPSVSILKGPLKAGSRFNRDYFKNEVLGKGAYKGTSVKDFESMSRAAQESLVLRKRKTLARGRSPTIMTGVTGATGSLTLGKPSLLGR